MARAPKPAVTQSRLARIVISLRDRDWTGIAIEFAVVTLGILLAFQIDQWGQDRRQALEERQFLERMWRETSEAIGENEWAMTMHGRFRQEFIIGSRALDDAAALARLATVPNIGCRATVSPGLGFNTTSFQEISASGRLNTVSDSRLRGNLRDVVAAQANANEVRDNAQPLSLEAQRALEPYLLLGLDENGNRTCNADWPRLATDPRARNAVTRAARLHTLLWLQRAWVRDTLATAHNRIACTLNKPDCTDKVRRVLRSRPLTDTVPPEAQQAIGQSGAMYNGS
jgi:hypothetical protein